MYLGVATKLLYYPNLEMHLESVHLWLTSWFDIVWFLKILLEATIDVILTGDDYDMLDWGSHQTASNCCGVVVDHAG